MTPAVRQIVLGRPSIPFAYFIEGWAANSFNGQHTGVPTGIASLPSDSEGAQFLELEVTGVATDTTLSGSGFDTVNGAGTWACVILHDDGTYGIYTASGITATTIAIAPALRADVTAGTLTSLHGSLNGQHYVEPGYRALGRHIYAQTKRSGYRQHFASKWQAQTDLKEPWVGVGGLTAAGISISVANAFGNTGYGSYWMGRGTRRLFFIASVVNRGVRYSVSNLGGRDGHLEIFVGIRSGTDPLRVIVNVDGVELLNETATYFKRFVAPFTAGQSGYVEVLCTTTNSVEAFIGDAPWWVYDRNETWTDPIINKNEKVVVIGDSWTTRYSAALGDELEQAMTDDGGTGTVVSVGQAGQTAAWGLANFDVLVTPEAPAAVVINFGINDLAALGVAGYQTWVDNLIGIARKCRGIGATPVIVMPMQTASVTQSASLGIWAERLGAGRPT